MRIGRRPAVAVWLLGAVALTLLPGRTPTPSEEQLRRDLAGSRPALARRYLEEAQDVFLAVANTVPLAWSGVDADLPEGVPDTLRRAFADEEAGIAPHGNVFRGTVAEWEQWADLALPESGRYIVPGALEPLHIDRERDEGVLIEPNVWMVHTVGW